MKRCVRFFLPVIIYLFLLSSLYAQQPVRSDVLFNVNRTADIYNRAYVHLNKGEMKIQGLENYGILGDRSPYTRHGDWGDTRWIGFFLGMPPGSWGADVLTEDLGVVDRSLLYNVVESFGCRLGDDGQDVEYSDWEAKDNSATRLFGDARHSNNAPMTAVSDIPLSWPEGYWNDSYTDFTETPGERHWPGPWALDKDPASPTYLQEIYGQFVSDRDIFFIMDDKYNGIRAGFAAGSGYPVGLDVHVTGYSWAEPYYDDLVFLKYDIIFRDDIAAEDASRQFYSGTIDTVYVGLILDPDLPGKGVLGYGVSPWAIDDYAYFDKANDLFIMYDKRGWTKDLGSPYEQGPVSAYAVHFLDTPENRGLTEYHYIEQDLGLTPEPVGPHFEEVCYSIMSGRTGLMDSDEEERLFFHADPAAADYPHFDHVDSLLQYNEFAADGTPYPTFYQTNAGMRPDMWYTIGCGPFTISPGNTYPFHIVIFGSDDNPGTLDAAYYDFPINTPFYNSGGLTDPTDRFADVYANLETARSLYTYGPTSVKDEPNVVREYKLHQNYPNPFNPETKIKFELPTAGPVTIVVYDILGREVVSLTDRNYTAGEHLLKWNGTNTYGVRVASGMYFYRIQADGFAQVRKMVILK